MLVMFAYLRVESDVKASVMLVVCEFVDIFPKDICDLLLEREAEIPIDLVPSIMLVLMAPYKMFASELDELKK